MARALLLLLLLTCALPLLAAAPHARVENFPLNIRVFRLVNDHHAPVIDRMAVNMETLGIDYEKLRWRIDLGIAWVLIPIFLYVALRRRHLLGALFLGLLIETVLVTVCKQLVDGEPRPAGLLTGVHQLFPLTLGSFPSGHTAMACVIAGVLTYRAHWAEKLGWVLFTAVIAYQRMYVGVHFPLDIIAGLAIGLVSAYATRWILRNKMAAPLER